MKGFILFIKVQKLIEFMEDRKIIRYETGQFKKIMDTLILEKRVKLFINKKKTYEFVTYPLNIRELVLGYLKTERFLHNYNEVQSFSIKNQNVHVKVQKDQKALAMIYRDDSKPIKINPRCILDVMKEFQNNSKLFAETGAVHGAALSDQSSILKQYPDIGRFNAADKVIGYSLISNIDLKDKWLLFTGRIFQKLVEKVATTDIKIIISLSAATASAIDLANELGILLIGFVKNNRFNVYTNVDRLEFSKK